MAVKVEVIGGWMGFYQNHS